MRLIIYFYMGKGTIIYYRMKTYIINFEFYKYTKVNFKYKGT